MRNSTAQMGSASLALKLLCIIMVSAMNAWFCASTEFKVGDREGWREPFGANETSMYDQWATRKRFEIGDSLRFEYRNDSVIEVDKWGFYHCNTSKPIATFTDGRSTVIKLDKPGSAYFVSGAPGHCKKGQRLVVEVPNPQPILHPPPGAASPPNPDSDASPSPSPVGNSAALVLVQSPLLNSFSVIGALVSFLWFE